jgi:hypothetical protein
MRMAKHTHAWFLTLHTRVIDKTTDKPWPRPSLSSRGLRRIGKRPRLCRDNVNENAYAALFTASAAIQPAWCWPTAVMLTLLSDISCISGDRMHHGRAAKIRFSICVLEGKRE